MSQNVDEQVHVLVSDSINHPALTRSVASMYRLFADRFDEIRN